MLSSVFFFFSLMHNTGVKQTVSYSLNAFDYSDSCWEYSRREFEFYFCHLLLVYDCGQDVET